MVVKSIIVKGYKSLASLRMKFPQFSLIAGPCGSGKTSILETIRLAAELVGRDSLDGAAVGWPLSFMTGSPGTPRSPSLVAEFDNGRAVEVPEETDPTQWRVKLPSKPQSITSLPTRILPDETYRAPIYHLNPRRLKLPSFLTRLETAAPHDTRPSMEGARLAPDGAQLAPVLNTLLGLQRTSFSRVEQRLAASVPSIERILCGPARVHGVDGLLGQGLWFDTIAAKRVPAAAMSEGILQLLAIYTLLELEVISPISPPLLLLEEPESGLHPLVQGDIVRFIRETIKDSPDLQVVMTSHSPYMLEAMMPEEVFLTRLDRSGHTQVARVADLSDVDTWTAGFSPTEVWTVGGADETIGRARR